MLLDLHHHVMNVDEFTADRQSLEWMLREDFLKSVIVLDQLRQGRLSKKKQECDTVPLLSDPRLS